MHKQSDEYGFCLMPNTGTYTVSIQYALLGWSSGWVARDRGMVPPEESSVEEV